MNSEIESKVKDFVKKFNNNELTVNSSKFGQWQKTTYGVNPIYEKLAKAIHDFEIIEPSKKKNYAYEKKIEDLNKIINLSISLGIINNTSTVEDNNRLKNEITSIRENLDIHTKTISDLKDKNAHLTAKLSLYEERYPVLKKSLGKGEGDVQEE